jgi:hypothetical protein
MIASIVLIKMKRYIRIFRSLNATAVSSAIIPQQYGIGNGLIFQKLVRKGILVPVDGERYYMDEQKEAWWTKRRRKTVIILMVIIILLLINTLIFALVIAK